MSGSSHSPPPYKPSAEAEDGRYRALVVQEAARRVEVVSVNQATLGLYGAEGKDALLGSLARLLEPETLPLFADELVAFAEGHAYFEAEGEIRTLRGESRTVLFNVALPPVTGSRGRVLATMTDLTARKRAEAAARESDARYRALAANLPAGAAFVVDHELRYLLAEGQGLAELGLSPADFEGKTLDEVFRPAVTQERKAYYRKVLAGESFGEEHASGERHYVSYGTPLRNASGEVYAALAVSYDITERKAAEAEREGLLTALAKERERLAHLNDTLEWRVAERTEEVRTLAAQLTLAEAKERARLAQVLHDSVQQQLYAAQFSLHDARRAASQSPAVLGALAETGAHLKEALALSRTTTANLSPPVLHHEGLIEALRWLGSDMQRRYSFTVNVAAHPTSLELHESVRVLLFNLVRELLFNVVKHAAAAEATVSVERTGEGLEITVSDAGQGFEPAVLDETPKGTGFGLSGVRERLALFGGTLDLASAKGRGTRVTITVPAAALTLD